MRTNLVPKCRYQRCSKISGVQNLRTIAWIEYRNVNLTINFQVLSRFFAKFIVLSRFSHFFGQIPGYFWTWTDKIQISRFSRFPLGTLYLHIVLTAQPQLWCLQILSHTNIDLHCCCCQDLCYVTATLYNSIYSGQQPSYRDIWNRTAVKSVPISFRSIFTHYFLYKYIVWSLIFISLLSSMFSSTLLIACTISVVPVQWLSLSVFGEVSSSK